jgi:hypothetical protein
MMIDSDQSKIMKLVDAWNLEFGAVRADGAASEFLAAALRPRQ